MDTSSARVRGSTPPGPRRCAHRLHAFEPVSDGGDIRFVGRKQPDQHRGNTRRLGTCASGWMLERLPTVAPAGHALNVCQLGARGHGASMPAGGGCGGRGEPPFRETGGVVLPSTSPSRTERRLPEEPSAASSRRARWTRTFASDLRPRSNRQRARRTSTSISGALAGSTTAAINSCARARRGSPSVG